MIIIDYSQTVISNIMAELNIAKALEIPARELQVEIPFRKDNGEIDSVIGFRVQLLRLHLLRVFTM